MIEIVNNIISDLNRDLVITGLIFLLVYTAGVITAPVYQWPKRNDQ